LARDAEPFANDFLRILAREIQLLVEVRSIKVRLPTLAYSPRSQVQHRTARQKVGVYFIHENAVEEYQRNQRSNHGEASNLFRPALQQIPPVQEGNPLPNL
jgi:hypothetical protein